MRRRSVLFAPLVLAACGGDPLAAAPDGNSDLVVGSANFPESELLAEMYAQTLEAAGLTVARRTNLGSREIYLTALRDGSIDLVPEYNGALLSHLAGEVPADANTPETVRAALDEVLPAEFTLLDQAQAQDRNTLVVTGERARANGLVSIADLAAVAPAWTLGAGAEFSERRQGLPGLRDVYGVEFAGFQALDAGGPLTVDAVRDGTVELGSLLSTDPVIDLEGFVVLTDPENLFGVQNVVPLVTTDRNSPPIASALNRFSAILTTEGLSAALGELTLERRSPADVAAEFLTANGVG